MQGYRDDNIKDGTNGKGVFALENSNKPMYTQRA
jgi:hypothetical protein